MPRMLVVTIVGALFCCAPSSAPALDDPLTVDRALAIPPLEFDGSGQLVVTASSTSSEADFDFLVGRWRLRNKKLECRLNGCTKWSDEFASFVDMEKALGGLGNIDRYYQDVNNQAFHGLAVRLFDVKTRLWSIYWADGSRGAFDVPVVGSFSHGVGHFVGRDTFNGRPIVVLFRWDVRNPQLPVWSQAFSPDNGRTWEWNSINVSERIF